MEHGMTHDTHYTHATIPLRFHRLQQCAVTVHEGRRVCDVHHDLYLSVKRCVIPAAIVKAYTVQICYAVCDSISQ